MLARLIDLVERIPYAPFQWLGGVSRSWKPRSRLVLALLPLVLAVLVLRLRLLRCRLGAGDGGCCSSGAARARVRAAAVFLRERRVDVSAVLRAEVVHVDGATAVGGRRGAHARRETDVIVVGRQDVRLVSRAVHPAVDHRLRRRKRTGAPAQVLADNPVVAV